MTRPIEQLRGQQLWTLRPKELAAVMVDLAEQIRGLDVETCPRHDVYPAADELRDALTGVLDGVEPWSRYETLRAEARRIGNLPYVVALLRAKDDRGGDRPDPEVLGAYQDELAAREGDLGPVTDPGVGQ